MKRLIPLSASLFFFLFSAFGQMSDPLVGSVADENGHPLPYVNIGIVGTTVGTVSGLNGSFEVFLTENVSGEDTLRFSMVGHESRSFAVADFIKKMESGEKVVLPAVALDLQEVVVRPRFTRTKQIGLERHNARMSTNFAISKEPNQNLGAEVGRKFNLPKGEVQLDTFRFYVARNNFDTVRLRVNVYEIKKGKPDRNIAPRNIIVELTNSQTGWIKVDLTPFQFMLSENVAVAVEWVYHSAKGRALALPIAMPSLGVHFYKYGSQGSWKTFPGMSSAMSLEVSY